MITTYTSVKILETQAYVDKCHEIMYNSTEAEVEVNPGNSIHVIIDDKTQEMFIMASELELLIFKEINKVKPVSSESNNKGESNV